MEPHVMILFCTCSAILLTSVVAPEVTDPRTTKRYRSDYVYNKKTDAFYKLHIESRSHYYLDPVCQVEGATLMNSRSNDDLIQLHSMFKKFPDLGEYVWVAEDGLSHESAEEEPLINLDPDASQGRDSLLRCEVINRHNKAEAFPCYRSLPFICKVKAQDAPYDSHCGVYGKDYKYFPSTGSCYKIPRIVYTWSEAYAECEAEGAHLVVLNSETEMEIVQNVTMSAPRMRTARNSWFFFAGYRANAEIQPLVFKTIFNQTLEEAGYAGWSANEPNNAGGREYCGTIFKNDGKLNDVDCSHTYSFICEKEVPNTSNRENEN